MPAVSLTVVSPGPVKDSARIRRVYAAARDEVVTRVREWENWPIWVFEETHGPTGPELLLAVDADPGDLKRALVSIEEGHPWGRLFDLDLVDIDAEDRIRHVTRELVGMEPRRCLVCDEPSVACARSRAHSLDELEAAVVALVGE